MIAGLPLIMASSTPRPADCDIYLLMGQSNMSGRGDVAALTAADRGQNPRIWLYGNDEHWRQASDPLDSATGQIDQVSADPRAGVGPGMSFARAMQRTTTRNIALVPCAKGGSKIAEWKRDADRATLYGSCLARARAAAPAGRIAAILWYQGESDTGDAAATAAWPARFAALVEGMRRDLQNPHLPAVYVVLADQPDGAGAGARAAERYRYWPRLQHLQDGIAIPCVTKATAQRLDRRADRLHLTTPAQIILGGRLALAMERVEKKSECGA